MTDFVRIFNSLRRPRLLIRAARIAQDDYRRERDLKRLTKVSTTPGTTAAVGRLLEQECALEATRKAGDAAYSITTHVQVLTALMAEIRLLPREA